MSQQNKGKQSDVFGRKATKSEEKTIRDRFGSTSTAMEKRQMSNRIESRGKRKGR